MKVGLALSGGGARGIAHAGVIKALEEMNVIVSCISGTSMGAIVGSLYAYGYTPDEILDIIKNSSLFRFIRPSWRWSSLLSMDKLEKLLLRHMPKNNFNQLRIPLSIAATEIRKAETHYFTTGKLISAVLASCAVPALFNPIQHNKGIYVDGGLLDNLPSIAIKYRCDFTVGSHCNPVSKNFDVNGANFKKIIERSMVIAIGSSISQSKHICDVLIEPQELIQFSSFEMSKAQAIFDAGYTFTKNNYSAQDFVKKYHE